MRQIEAMEMWRLADELSIIDAAILITGNDPSNTRDIYDGTDTVRVQDTSYDGFDAAFKALKNAVLSNRLAAAPSFPVGRTRPSERPLRAVLRDGKAVFVAKGLNYFGYEALVYLQGEPDWDRTTVDVSDLKEWLKGRGVYPEFFFPVGDPETFMNAEHPRYSAKMACAIAAWKAVTFPARNKTPKQTIAAWVAANGVQYGLGNDEGVVSQTAIDEIAKVVNWQTEGGAAKTGGEVATASPEVPLNIPDNFRQIRKSPPAAPAFESPPSDPFEDIPF